MGKLYKVYIQTDDHPHILEMIVTANTKAEARKTGLGHVKEANPTKGRDQQISQKNSKVLAVTETGKNGALVISKISVKVANEIAEALNESDE